MKKPLTERLAQKAKDAVGETKKSGVVSSNVKWAKNTAIGTAKGVAIAAAANIGAETVRNGLRKGLKHKRS